MRKPPERSSQTFFVDVDLGKNFFAGISNDPRFNVEFHDDHFNPREGVDDSEWLMLVARNGWVGVTHDKKIRREHRPLIERAGARVIVVIGKRPLGEQARNFVETYPKIERFVSKHSAPYIAKLYYPTPKELERLRPKGRIELWGEW